MDLEYESALHGDNVRHRISDGHGLAQGSVSTNAQGWCRGVDGVTAEEYEQDLEGNLQSPLDRAKSGTYKAPPVRRVRIPKGG